MKSSQKQLLPSGFPMKSMQLEGEIRYKSMHNPSNIHFFRILFLIQANKKEKNRKKAFN
jgi:hypothetical protein